MSEAETARLKKQIRAARDPRDKERLQVVHWATSGQPTLKLAVQGEANRNWWREIRAKLTALPNGYAVASLQA